VQLLWKAVWKFLKKTKNRNTIQSSDTTLGYTLKEYATGYDRVTRTPMLIAALFIYPLYMVNGWNWRT
jgi:hypothetical protein